MSILKKAGNNVFALGFALFFLSFYSSANLMFVEFLQDPLKASTLQEASLNLTELNP